MRIRKKTNKKLKKTNKTNKRTRKFRKYNKRRANLVGGEEGEEGEEKKRKRVFIEGPSSSLDDVNKRAREEKKQQRLREDAEKEAKKIEIDRLQQLHSNLLTLSRRERPILPEKNVVEQSASRGYTGHAQVSSNEIDKFVEEKISEGPQIVNFAVGNYNHAILVDVQPDKVMISDWKGDPRLSLTGNENYRNYFELLDALEKKHPVEYYPIDLYLRDKADKQNILKGNAGGCSEYLYNWINVYYRPGRYFYPF